MANSLRAKLSKLRHDGHITDNEYQAFLKKIDGHDREIYNKAIDDFFDEALYFENYIEPIDTSEFGTVLLYSGVDISNMIVKIKEELVK